MDKLEDYFYRKLQEAVEILDELEQLGLDCPMQQSKIDQELSDWLHMIQHEDLNDAELVKVSKKIKELRIKREKLNNLWDLAKIYNEGRDRLVNSGNREFLMNTIRKKYKNFNQEYNNRILDKEKVQEVLGDKKIKRTNDEKRAMVKELIENNGEISNNEIHQITGISMPTIIKYRKEIQ